LLVGFVGDVIVCLYLNILDLCYWLQVALVTEPKDKETAAMYKQALELLTQALEVWPNANVKFNYLEKILTSLQPTGQSKDPLTALAQGLDVMNKVLEKQPQLFIRNNVQHIIQVMDLICDDKELYIL
jgi:transformation/transcription domain-associated protein